MPAGRSKIVRATALVLAAGVNVLRLLDSKPQVLVIPRKKHKVGDREDLGDGVVVEWIDERCLYMHEPGFALLKSCASPRNLSAERAAALEQAVKPKYLGGTRPLADEPVTTIKIP
jgi:hypothetical protein